MKIIVTGANGFLGKHLVEKLFFDNQVICLVRNKESFKLSKHVDENIKTISIDLSQDLDFLMPEVKDADCLFHLAAIPNIHTCQNNPRQCFDSNIKATFNILELCRKANIKKIIFSSSSAVYGESRYLPIDEDHPLSPSQLFSATKVASENLIKSYSSLYGIKAVIFRIFNLYGDDHKKRIVSLIIENALISGFMEVNDSSFTRDFLHVDDAVSALIIAIKRGEGTYNLGSGEETSIWKLAQKVNQITKNNFKIISKKVNLNKENPRSCAEIIKARTELGWEPQISLDQGLKRLIEHFN